MTKLVAFDLVGTLVRGEIFTDARDHLRIDFNQNWQDAARRAGFFSNFSYEAVFEQYLNENSAHLLYQSFRTFLLEEVLNYLYSDVITTLKTLLQSGCRLGFVTDGQHAVEGEMIRKLLRYGGIDPDVCILVTAEDVGSGKVSGEPFLRLIQKATQLGILMEDIIFIGDRPEIDIEGARSAHLMTALLSRNGFVENTQQDFQISTLSELQEIIDLESPK